MIISQSEVLEGSRLVLLEGDALSRSAEGSRPHVQYHTFDPHGSRLPGIYTDPQGSRNPAHYISPNTSRDPSTYTRYNIARDPSNYRNHNVSRGNYSRGQQRDSYYSGYVDPVRSYYGLVEDEYLKGNVIRGYLRGAFVDDMELLGSNDFDALENEELLGFTKAVTNEGVYILPYIIDGDKIQTVEDIQEYKQFLRGLFGEEYTSILSGESFDSMIDEELLGFFKKLWKGIKKGVSSVGKFVGKVGKGIAKGVGNVAKGVAKGVGKVVKGAGKVIGNVAKGVWKGAGKVIDFVGKNAGGLLKAGLSFLPGGSMIAALVDQVTSSNQEQTAPPSESQRMDYSQPVEEYYSPELSTEMPGPESQGMVYYSEEPVEYYEEPQDYEYYPEEYVQGNLFKKIGNVTKWISSPENMRKVANYMNTSAESVTQLKEGFKSNPIVSRQQQLESEARNKVKAYGGGFLDSYGIYIIIGLGALLLISTLKSGK